MLVSVLMPVRNEENRVSLALKSLLHQTYSELQIVIVDDGSNDRTIDEVAGFGDSRVQVVFNERHLGIVESLNKGLEHCKGELRRKDGCR